jgi:rhodanese-related sulfurtransferase
MNSREFKDSVFQHFAMIAQAFSSPKRLEIIDVLAQGERDVETLAQEVSMTMANTSQHLKTLKNARLVENRKLGVQVFYRIADNEVLSCWKGLQTLAEKRIAEIKEVTRMFFEERDGMEPISRDELRERIQNGDIIVLDVRPVEEYKSGHLPNAVSIPITELSHRLNEIPKDCEVVSYCRGRYCVLSAEAVVILRNTGRKALRLEEGFPEWREAGLPVKTLK